MTIRRILENFSNCREVWLFIRIACFITILPVILTLFSLPKVMHILTPGNCEEGDSSRLETDTGKIIKFTDYILNLNFWIYKNTCLKRALVLYHFLRKTGLDVQFCLGVHFMERNPQNNDMTNMQGHAWLLHEDEYFSEKNIVMTKQCKITYRFPGGVTQ